MIPETKKEELDRFFVLVKKISKDFGLYVNCIATVEEETENGYDVYSGLFSSCEGDRLERLLWESMAANNAFHEAVISALALYEKSNIVNTDID